MKQSNQIIVISLNFLAIAFIYLRLQTKHLSLALPWVLPDDASDLPFVTSCTIQTSTDLKFHYKFEEDFEYCKDNNYVNERHQAGRQRIFSITEKTFTRHHPTICNTTESMLSAIRNGKRNWINATLVSSSALLSLAELDQHPSYFVPDGCDVPALTSNQMCDIMSRYSDIALDGDSIGRHIRQGFFIGLTEDLVLGGIHSSSKMFAEDTPYNHCRCDGQFSEALECRQNDGIFHNMTPHALGVCSHVAHSRHFTFPALYAGFKDLHFACEDPDYRGMLLILQAGPWYLSRGESIYKWFDEHFHHEQFQKCLRYNKVDVIWLGFGTTQTPAKDKDFPMQNRENVEKFNEHAKNYFANVSFPVTILDWVNLTWGAQSSDGFHGLAEVNLVKAYQILNVANLLRTADERGGKRRDS
jgi:hypothetical protein